MVTMDLLTDTVLALEKSFTTFHQKSEKTLDDLAGSRREINDRLLQLEQRGGRAFHEDGGGTATAGLGGHIAKAFDKNAELFFKSRSLRLEVKTVLQGQVGMTASRGPVPLPSPVKSSLVSAINKRPISGVANLTYSRITDSGAAAEVQNGEGAAKTQVQPTFAAISQNAITIAGFCVMSEQALKTQGELASVIDTHLSNKVLSALDDVLIDGTAVVSWPFAGLEALAVDYTSATYTLLHDAIVESAAHMRWGGYEPNMVVLNPMSFLGIALAKDTTGQYLSGAYMGELPAILHGMQVLFSSAVAVGKALVIDGRYIELLVSNEMSVLFAYTGDDFTKNLVTARGEVAVIPVVRDVNALNLVTPKAS